METPQAESEPTIVHERDAAVRRLRQLGLEPGDLAVALDAGEVAARQPDHVHPTTASGAYRWYETVAALRRGLEGKGWVLSDLRNSPRVSDSGS